MAHITYKTAKIGLIVCRGKDWSHGNQDYNGKTPGKGKIVDTPQLIGNTYWVRVDWEGGVSNQYRVGPKLFDLAFIPTFNEDQKANIQNALNNLNKIGI